MASKFLVFVFLGLALTCAQAQDTNATNATINPNANAMQQLTSTRTGNANMCPNLQYAFRGICVDLCPAGYTADNETRTCMKSAALNCTNGTYIHEGTCVATCPEGFVANNATQSCLRNATDLLIGMPVEEVKTANATENKNVTEAQTAAANVTDVKAQSEESKKNLRFRM